MEQGNFESAPIGPRGDSGAPVRDLEGLTVLERLAEIDKKMDRSTLFLAAICVVLAINALGVFLLAAAH